MLSSSVCDSGIIGPATAPCSTRNASSIGMLVEMPQPHDAIEKSSIESTKSFTSPTRRASQPVSGTAIALLTAKDVITHVPWEGDTPSSPEMPGMETLAMEESSTTMKLAAASATVSTTRSAPSMGLPYMLTVPSRWPAGSPSRGGWRGSRSRPACRSCWRARSS